MSSAEEKSFSDKLSVIKNKITDYIDKKNIRQVKKYLSELKALEEKFDSIDINDKYSKVADLSDIAEEFIFEYEGKEINNRNKDLLKVRINDLSLDIDEFLNILTDVKEKISKGIIVERNENFDKLDKERKNICIEYSKCDEEMKGKIKILEDKFQTTKIKFQSWKEMCVKVNFNESSDSLDDSLNTSTKPQINPRIKVEALSLPTFKGNVRLFPKFLREFEITVGSQYTESSTKLMILQNQCLFGYPKELIIHLTSFDDAMKRLKQYYGRPNLTIESVIKELKEFKLSQNDSINIMNLDKFLTSAEDDLRGVKSWDEFNNVVVLKIIESKMSLKTQELWAERKAEIMDESSINIMSVLKEFIRNRSKIAQTLETIGVNHKPDLTTKINCNFNISKKGCFRCGFNNHLVKDCRYPRTVKCNNCGKEGHLDRVCWHAQNQVAQESNINSTEQTYIDEMRHKEVGNVMSNDTVRLPFETISTTVGNCLAFWDSGSMINLVSKNWVSKTNLKGKNCKLKYKTVDGSLKTERSKMFNIPIRTRKGEVKVITAYQIDVMGALVEKLNDKVLNGLVKEPMLHEKIDESFGFADLLIGIGLINDFPRVVQVFSEMAVMSSAYGIKEYFICGGRSSVDHSVSNVQFVGVTPLHEVCENFKEYETDFEFVEELGIRPPPVCKNCQSCKICKPAAQYASVKELSELNTIKSKLTYNEENQCWTAEYPFKRDPKILNNNFNIAFNALKRREKKLKKDEVACKLYSDQIKDFVNRGVLTKLSKKEIENWEGPVRYVDHHEVYKESTSTPLRIVINSSFKTGNELSFNDILMKGPNVLTNILEILVRWRLYPVAFIGDISKMYHNVLTGPTERHLRRLLWRECDQDKPPDTYCFNTVTFGDRPAGCIVVSALKATADMFDYISPEAAKVIQNDSYMDDILSGANSNSEAKALMLSIEKIAEKGSFKFKEFEYSGIRKQTNEPTKTLGIQWFPEKDNIQIKISLNHNKKVKGKRKVAVEIEEIPFSKRICLRIVNGIFDPLGLVAPVTVKLKILMKNQFNESQKYKKWDTLLMYNDKLEWIKILRDIANLNAVVLPRQCIQSNYPSSEEGNFSLICFTDASTDAMCAAVYIRFQSNDGNLIKSGLVTAKTKLPTSKTQTIPKLELHASLLGARLLDKIRAAIRVEFNQEYFFVDSKIVLGALSKGSLANSFSGSCIAEIRNKAQNAKFGWIQSKDNIADIGSRGASCNDIEENSLWQKGPLWLYQKIEEWPVEFTELQEIPFILNVEMQSPFIDVVNFSDIYKLHRVTAICIKFVRSRTNNIENKKKVTGSWKDIRITADDLKEAEIYWIKEESKCVLKLMEQGKLDSLRPIKIWDAQGKYLKVVTSGRLGKLLKIGYDTEELTILDQSHPYTRLLLKSYHDAEHSSDDRVVWKSRERFWIPQARRIVRKIRQRCYKCKLLNKKYAQQIMAPLPKTRVIPMPAWTNTSIDLFGPLEHVDLVKKRLKEKCWGVLFTCLVSRAVHIDLTQSYDTDSLLQTMRRFMAVRGCPQSFISDQGSQLIACHKELKTALELIDWDSIYGWCARKEIKWSFMPAQGQHMNGVAESLIRVTKNHLTRVIEGQRLTFVEIQTVLLEITQIMNNRPLGIFSKPGTDPLDGGPITPNHLLLGRASNKIPELQFSNMSNTKRIRFLKSIVDEFWFKWQVVAFHSLVPQYKWHKNQRDIKI